MRFVMCDDGDVVACVLRAGVVLICRIAAPPPPFEWVL